MADPHQKEAAQVVVKLLRPFTAVDEHGDLHAFQSDVFQELLNRQLITRLKDGGYFIHSTVFDLLHQRPWLAVCDFCGSRPVAWDVTCEDFVVADSKHFADGDGDHVSRGDWAACEPCGTYIEARSALRLLARAITTYKAWQGRPHAALVEAHNRFWAQYKGQIKRIDVKQP